MPFSFRYNDTTKENQLDRTISVETAEYLINTFGLEEKTAEIKKFSLNDAIYNLNNWAVSKYVDENGYPDSEEFRAMAKEYYIYQYNKDDNYVLTDDDYKEIYKTYLQSYTFYVDENRVSHPGGNSVNKFGTAGYVLVRPFIKEVYRLENVTSIINASGDVSLSSKFDTSTKITEKYKVVGYYLPTVEVFLYTEDIPIVDYHIISNYFPIIVPDSYYDFFEEEEDSYYEFAIGKMPYTDAAAVKKIEGHFSRAVIKQIALSEGTAQNCLDGVHPTGIILRHTDQFLIFGTHYTHFFYSGLAGFYTDSQAGTFMTMKFSGGIPKHLIHPLLFSQQKEGITKNVSLLNSIKKMNISYV